jgi:hypothetical protein
MAIRKMRTHRRGTRAWVRDRLARPAAARLSNKGAGKCSQAGARRGCAPAGREVVGADRRGRSRGELDDAASGPPMAPAKKRARMRWPPQKYCLPWPSPCTKAMKYHCLSNG